ncbi:MAG TPA: ATP-binding cassette domain-containing protein [Acidimicrobiia bacterium]|nr:ATP-binding cassette domain-containing protein [Acidimicrobiia bacterium]
MTATVDARQVVKRFGRVEALAGLDLVIEPGQVVAVLGPNGAGKTTFVRTLATLLRPDGGTVRVGGFDVVRQARQVRSFIGLAGQHAAVEAAMTGRENLEMVAHLYGNRRATARARAADVIDALALGEVADRLVRTYSGGQRRRLDLGVSLVGAPRLLLLDEPTTGLDPRSRIELWDAIRELVRGGSDVLLTTQYLDEADQLAGRIVIIDRGRVIADGTQAELKARVGRDVVEVRTRGADDLPAAARALATVGGGQPAVDAATRRVSVPVDNGIAQLTAAARVLEAAGVAADDLSLRRPTLDEVFLVLTGAAPADAEPERQERRSA